jgi:hypothetical protein
MSPPLLSSSHFSPLNCNTCLSNRVVDGNGTPKSSIELSRASERLPRVLVSYVLCFVPDCERIIACLAKDWSCDDTYKEMTCAWVGLRASTLLRNRMTDLVGLAPVSRRTSWKCLFLSLRRKANYHSAQGTRACLPGLWADVAECRGLGTAVTAIARCCYGFLVSVLPLPTLCALFCVCIRPVISSVVVPWSISQQCKRQSTASVGGLDHRSVPRFGASNRQCCSHNRGRR